MSEKTGTKGPSSRLPEGTVTFLFTDIVGSTRLWLEHPQGMPAALEQHHNFLQAAIEKHDGYVFQIIGDAVCAAFEIASEALHAALEVQRSLKNANWDKTRPILVRTALHTGPVELKVGEYTSGEYVSGLTLSQTSRLLSAGYGGQILLSNATAQLVQDYLPENMIIKDMGAHRLRDLDRADTIYQVITPDLPAEFPLLNTLDARPNNLSIQPTPFVGRRDELVALEALITDPDKRLVCIVGAGGMGKSRLAIEIAEQQLIAMTSSNGKDVHRFPDGVFFVRLAPLESTEALIPTIAEAFGFTLYGGADPKQQILDFFRHKKLLLVMDNFEHLLPSTPLMAEILETAPDVRILATSREKLNLRGEVIYPLVGMRFPEEQELKEVKIDLADGSFSAVELFLQSARRIRPDFAPDAEEMVNVGRICRLVEGMPLGVELAVTWMEMLSPEEIVAEIEASLDFLEAERRDAPERHHSIRAVFDYTWKLLDEREREVLSKISVFRGGFTVEAARDVAGASLKQLLGLMNKSLLHRTQEGRFDIHELLRQYAAEKLDQEEEAKVRDQHCDYYADYLQEKGDEIGGGRQGEAVLEIDNIRAFYRWAITQHKFDAIRKSAYGFVMIFFYQGWYAEARDTFEQALQASQPYIELGENYCVHGLLRLGLGWFQGFTGIWEKAFANIRQGHSIIHKYGTKREIAIANETLEGVGGTLSDSERIQFMEENLAISEEIGVPVVRNFAIQHLGGIALRNHEWEEAEKLFQEALILGKDSNHPRFVGLSYSALGDLAFQKGDYAKAKGYCEESLTYAWRVGYKMLVTDVLNLISEIALAQEDFDGANEVLQESLELAKYSGDRYREADIVRTRGMITYEMGELVEAEKHYQEALSIYRMIDEDVGIGILMCDLGNVALRKGKYREATENYQAAIELGLRRAEGISDWAIAYCISCMAIFYARVEENRKVVELATLSVGHPKLLQYMKAKMTKLLAELQKAMSEKDFSEAQERGRERNLVATAEEMLEVLERGDLRDKILTSDDQG